LIIDPTLTYSTYLGGTDGDIGHSIAVDNEGNVYITGETISTDFPTTAGAFQTTLNGSSANAFITKLASDGSTLSYSTYLGGTTSDSEAYGIAVDTEGNAYITGQTDAIDFPTTAGAFQTVNYGVGNVFLTKLNPTGTELLYSTYLGGSIADVGSGIAVDGGGFAYISGYTYSTDFPTTPGAFQTVSPMPPAGYNAFVAKLNTNTTGSAALVYSTYLGESNNGSASISIAVDSAGYAYVTGFTYASNFPTTTGAFQTTNGTDGSAFITKFNTAGSALVYSTFLGGANAFSEGNSIVVDSDGNAYITGDTAATDFPSTVGAFQTTFTGTQDAFITKLNAAGSTLLYSSYLGGNNTAQGHGIAIDAAGDAYITGWTDSTDFPTTASAFQTTFSGTQDAFVAKVNSSGSALLYSTYLGGSSTAQGHGIAIDAAGDAYIAGQTDSTNFPITTGAFQTIYGGGSNDAFIAKFAIGSPIVTSVSPNSGPSRGGTTVTITGARFTGATSVNFGLTPVASFTVDSDTQITAISPSGSPGTVDITVETPVGTSSTSPTDQFTYLSTSTEIALAVFPNPAIVGQTVTLTASVFPSSATGTVSFFNGEEFIGIATLSDGRSVLTTSFLKKDVYSLKAVYNGNEAYDQATSSSVFLIVNLPSTTTRLFVKPNPAKKRQTITLRATVSPFIAKGKVTFLDGFKVLGVKKLSKGVAVLKTDKLSAGKHSLIAFYHGNHAFNFSISPRVVLRVKPKSLLKHFPRSSKDQSSESSGNSKDPC